MTTKTYFRSITTLSVIGVIFSGYLSGQKLLTSQCAFNETCPYFLGFPACYYGFVLFLLIFVSSLLGGGYISKQNLFKNIIFFTTFVGLMFAGQWAVPEFRQILITGKANYFLGLPTCLYGFIMYFVMFILSVIEYNNEN